MKKSPKVSVIILNYNNLETLKECLGSVFQSDYPNFEVIVADNSSTDGSLELLRAQFERAHLIQNGANLGFAGGNNPAIRFALEKFADYIFLLNPDAFIERGTISRLVKTAEQNERVGIVSPLILKGWSDKIWFCGGKIDWLKMRATHIQSNAKNLPADPYPTEYATGCAMLIKKDVFKEIGLLDEDYFLYYEDTDFSYRARKKGFEIMLDPRIIVRHWEKSNDAGKQKIYWLVFSGLIFFQKNVSFYFRPWIFFYTLLRKLKNYYNLRGSASPQIKIVRKAYHDYKLWKKDRNYQSFS